MIPESKLKSDCTPDIIKKMCELADMVKYYEAFGEDIIYGLTCHGFIFPLLIHRAVEGWNRLNKDKAIDILNFKDYTQIYHIPTDNKYDDIDYQPQSLTPCECACLHCLIEVLG